MANPACGILATDFACLLGVKNTLEIMNKNRALYSLLLSCIWLLSSAVGAVECAKEFPHLTESYVQQDQAARTQGIEMSKGLGEPSQRAKDMVNEVDGRSTLFVREALRDCGWPKKSVVGDGVVGSFSLLVIHATNDQPLQRYALHLMDLALAEHEADGQSFALLTDKVLRGANLPQRYGTQLDWSFKVQELENPSEVDARRAALGMSTLDEYIALVTKTFSGLNKDKEAK